jgi:ABC-type sugar transport system ATPase subunit
MVGQHVVLGMRPEHFHLQPTGGEGDCCPLKVQLNVIEPLGNDMDVYMNTLLHDHVVGRVEAQQGLQMNTQATVYVDLRKVHFFEPGVTGMNLSLAKEPAHALA